MGLLHLEAHAGGIPAHLLPVIQRIPVGKGIAGLAVERQEPVDMCNLQTDSSGRRAAGGEVDRRQGLDLRSDDERTVAPSERWAWRQFASANSQPRRLRFCWMWGECWLIRCKFRPQPCPNSSISTPKNIPANPFIRLNPNDNVVVARVSIPASAEVEVRGDFDQDSASDRRGPQDGREERQRGRNDLQIRRRYRFRAGKALSPGEWVHTHNLLFDVADRKYEFGTSLTDLADIPVHEKNSFMGYPRSDGRAGTRNYVAIVGASNCSSFATQKIADAFANESFEGTGIDGVMALPHEDGCGKAEGDDANLLRRTLEGAG